MGWFNKSINDGFEYIEKGGLDKGINILKNHEQELEAKLPQEIMILLSTIQQYKSALNNAIKSLYVPQPVKKIGYCIN